MVKRDYSQVYDFVRQQLRIDQVEVEAVLQELWSGYGQLLRLKVGGAEEQSVILKLINWKQVTNHPRGWASDFSHQRKLNSYKVEAHWYRDWQAGGDNNCYLPNCIEVKETDDQMLILMEDLRERGYTRVKQSVYWKEVLLVVRWLAYFHAKHIKQQPTGLWEEGTYWHLNTRPQELAALEDQPLKDAAKTIDSLLNSARFQTIVHGDAKLANFCFSRNDTVAAVDFQYVGGGCGMKDLAYFIGSCLSEEECEDNEEEILNYYFSELDAALIYYQQKVDFEEVQNCWRPLYRVAWADFHRFLKGWSPGHWKINTYSEKVVRDVISRILL